MAPTPRHDLVALLDQQSLSWRAPLTSPSVRRSDGLAADSPMGWQGTPWFQHVGVRIGAFSLVATLLVVLAQAVRIGLGVTGAPWWQPLVVELVPIVVAYVLVVTVLESRRHAIEYAPARWLGLPIGLAAGAAVCLVAAGIVWALGGIVFTGTNPNPPWLSQLVSLGVVAGIAEEIALRGVLFRYVESLLGTWTSVAISALIFGVLHLANPHATMTGALAIAVEAGLMFALLYALTRSLWVVIGVHAGWNLMQGLGLGIVVSGSTDVGEGFLVSHPAGPEIISGGEFGIEASVVAVAVWLVVAAYLAWRLVRTGGVVRPAWTRHRTLPGNPLTP